MAISKSGSEVYMVATVMENLEFWKIMEFMEKSWNLD